MKLSLPAKISGVLFIITVIGLVSYTLLFRPLPELVAPPSFEHSPLLLHPASVASQAASSTKK